jgi:hypothetical protein
MRRKIVLASFGSPQLAQEFDHGISKWEVLDTDDLNKEEYDIIDRL